MIESSTKNISPKIGLISATLIHCGVEIPFFIFPVILLVIGEELFPNLGELSWIGLGALGTIGILAAGLPSPIFGRLADKYRRGTLMLISLLLAASGAFTVGIFGKSIVFMLLGVILMGSSLALYHPAGLSWISSAYEDPNTLTYSPNYVKILASHGIGGSIGSSIGPLSVYFLINTIGWRTIYLIWSIPLILLAIAFWILVGRHESPSKPSVSNIVHEIEPINHFDKKSYSKYSALFLIFAFITVMSLTRGMITFILSPFLSEVKGFTIATAGLYIGMSALVGSSGQVIGGYFGDKISEKAVLSFTGVFQAIILIGIFISPGTETEVIFLLYILLGVMNALFWPSTNSLVAKNSAQRGVAFGWVMLIANFVGALGPSIDGFLLVIDPNQYLLIFFFACLFSLCGFFSLLFYRNSSPTNKQRS